MAKARKPKSAASNKLDPSKATIYVALVTLLGAITAAAISNVDKFRVIALPDVQAEEIIAFQEYKYAEVSEVLDERVSEAQAEETKLAAPKHAKRAAQIRRYIKDSRDTKVAVAQKHTEFKAAIKGGDYFKANVLKTEVNELLGKEQERYTHQFNVRDLQRRGSGTSYRSFRSFYSVMLQPAYMLGPRKKIAPYMITGRAVPGLRSQSIPPAPKTPVPGSTAAPAP